MIRTAITVLAIIALLGWFGPALDDHSAEQAQADALQDAQHQAQAQARYDAAVQQLCGPNAAWMQLQDGAIQCTDKRGTPTRRVALSAITITAEVSR